MTKTMKARRPSTGPSATTDRTVALTTSQKAVVSIEALGERDQPVPIPADLRCKSTNPKVVTVVQSKRGFTLIPHAEGRSTVTLSWTVDLPRLSSPMKMRQSLGVKVVPSSGPVKVTVKR